MQSSHNQQFHANPKSDVLSERERIGLALFYDRAHCAECHRIDGSYATLEEAVKYETYYLTNTSVQTTNLTQQEQADILAFLKSLTDVRYEKSKSNMP